MNPYDEQLARWATKVLQGFRPRTMDCAYSIKLVKKWHEGNFDKDWHGLWDVDKIRAIRPDDLDVKEEDDMLITWCGVSSHQRQ